MNAALRVAAASLLALSAAGCGSSAPAPAQGAAQGTTGVSFDVVVSRQPGGTVTSQDGQIRCGTGGTACSGTYAWSAQAVLTATPDPGFAFGTWAGDCQYTGPCVLDTRRSGADKFVAAVFGPGGEVQHGNFSSPARHGPAFLDRLGGVPGSLDCSSASCHGPTYGGLGIAPSCNACHAAAGWTEWRTNCTFCHGERARSGYEFASDPVRAAPPDAVQQRLTGTPAPARSGAHAQHLTGITAAGVAVSAPFQCGTCHAVPSDLSHVGGSTARATVALSGAGQASLPQGLGSYDPAAGTCSTYCHGDGKVPGTSPAFAGTGLACDGCHAVPPTSGHPSVASDLTGCAECHPHTMRPDGTLDATAGRHVDGVIQACNSCHGFAPETGAHTAHFGLTGSGASGYGDTRALEELFPAEAPTTAPAVYAFGCGSCHPLGDASHRNGAVEVALHDAAAPAQSLKSLAAPTAAYDPASGTCSGVYCHSSGQESPVFRTTPAWASGDSLGCDGCHDNPPRYASGGPGSSTANGHVALDPYLFVAGHFGSIGAVGHAGRHGGPVDGEAAITCQTCHFDTTDPASTGVSGFYWLDTTGDYQLPGADLRQGPVNCTTCHTGSGDAAVATGRVLPLRHVNGTRDVVFDPRTDLDASIAYLPGAPNTPTRPYYRTNDTSVSWRNVVRDGTTASFDLTGATYEPASKTCDVACHRAAATSGIEAVWGAAFQWNCSFCHDY